MGKIFYSVSGEGRGHATRLRAIVEDLRDDHDIVIYTPGLAGELLEPVYRDTEVEVRSIPGLHFHYNERNRLNYFKTGWYGIQYLAQYPDLNRRLREEMEKEEPDIVISDFEPALPRAARRMNIPFISLNHQHFLVTYDLSSLPPYLQRHAAFMSHVVQAYYSGQEETIVSSFYFPPLKPGFRNVTQIGVLLRPEVLAASPEQGSHVTVYLRRFNNSDLLKILEDTGREIHIYGLGLHPSRGNLRFFEIDAFRFVEDLATGCALVSTAGNQLVGEALFFGKPVLALPEEGNFEQYINAHFLQESGGGMFLEMNDIDSEKVLRFLSELDDYRSHIDRARLFGNPHALAVINRYLPENDRARSFSLEQAENVAI